MKILTHVSSQDKEWSKLCIESQQEYAELHGFKHIIVEDISLGDRSIEWSRFRTMQGFMTGSNLNEIAVWMDSDLMIMNPEFNLIPILEEFKKSSPDLAACIFPIDESPDLSMVFLKVTSAGKHIFEYGWSVGKVEAQGERRDKLSFELMVTLDPKTVNVIEPNGILSRWYPESPLDFFNHKIDTADGKLGQFIMKKPKEMLEGFKDLYLPGTFAVHLRAKGPYLLHLSHSFLEYKKQLLADIEKSRKLMKDLW
jgi:hypothetical protein